MAKRSAASPAGMALTWPEAASQVASEASKTKSVIAVT
jgi:hypothetical protein